MAKRYVLNSEFKIYNIHTKRQNMEGVLETKSSFSLHIGKKSVIWYWHWVPISDIGTRRENTTNIRLQLANQIARKERIMR